MPIKDMIKFRNGLSKNTIPSQKVVNELIEKYKNFITKNTTFRTSDTKSKQIKLFKLKNRKGIHHTSVSGKTKPEDTLCQSLFNAYEKDLLIIKNFSQNIVDYQTPLSNARTTGKDWGKIDLIGYIKDSPDKKLCFWEVKLGEISNSIIYAICEVMIYFAQFDCTNIKNLINSNLTKMVELNYETLITEIKRCRNHPQTSVLNSKYIKPIIFIAGDKKYFDNQKYENNKSNIQYCINQIKEKLGIDIHIIEIGNYKIQTDEKIADDKYYPKFKLENEIKVLMSPQIIQ